MKALFRLMLVFALTTFSSCSDDVDQTFANYPAFLRYTQVATTPPLRAALENPGIFCLVSYDSRYYYFKGSTGLTSQQNRTAADNYGPPMSVAGFIVGMPSVPDLNSGLLAPKAYDLACPTCYELDAIQRSLEFDKRIPAGNVVVCSRCESTYDLNNGGMPISGPNGYKKLFHYRLYYTPSTGTLVIQN